MKAGCRVLDKAGCRTKSRQDVAAHLFTKNKTATLLSLSPLACREAACSGLAKRRSIKISGRRGSNSRQPAWKIDSVLFWLLPHSIASSLLDRTKHPFTPCKGECCMPNSPWHIRQRNESDTQAFVHEAVQDFLASTEVKRLVPKTQAEYTHVLTTFAAWCDEHTLAQDRKTKTWKALKADSTHGPIMLHMVNDQAVYCFLQHVQETHTPSKKLATKISSHTIANYAKGIKRFLNWCLLDDHYSEHVKAITVQRIKKPKLDEVILETFSFDQIDALKKACTHEEIRTSSAT